MNDDARFSCAACQLPSGEDGPDTMTACRLCGRIHCNECVDEHGRCMECRDKGAGEH